MGYAKIEEIHGLMRIEIVPLTEGKR